MKDFICVSDLEAVVRQTPECPLNGAAMHPHMHVPVDWRRPEDHREWDIWWDDSAAFGQIFPRPKPEDVSAFYDFDGYYTHAERLRPDSETEAKQVGLPGHVLRSLAYRLENGAEPTRAWWRSIIPQDAKQGLEVGCGDGDRMLTYCPFLEHVCGVEPDPRAVQVAQDRGLEVYPGTAEDLPDEVRDRTYDLIVFSHVLEHTIDPILSLSNAKDMLSQGGLMSVEVPNNASIGAQRMGKAWRWLDAPRHLNFFTAESLTACAESAGLTVHAVLYRGYVRQFTPDWIVDEARISAAIEGRTMTQADINRQVWHSAKLLAATALVHPSRKYDSVRILCGRT